MIYILNNRAEATKEQIEAAFKKGSARLVHGYGVNKIETMLSLDNKDWDTRGQNEMMEEDSWTQTPENLKQCYHVAVAGY